MVVCSVVCRMFPCQTACSLGWFKFFFSTLGRALYNIVTLSHHIISAKFQSSKIRGRLCSMTANITSRCNSHYIIFVFVNWKRGRKIYVDKVMLRAQLTGICVLSNLFTLLVLFLISFLILLVSFSFSYILRLRLIIIEH